MCVGGMVCMGWVSGFGHYSFFVLLCFDIITGKVPFSSLALKMYILLHFFCAKINKIFENKCKSVTSIWVCEAFYINERIRFLHMENNAPGVL